MVCVYVMGMQINVYMVPVRSVHSADVKKTHVVHHALCAVQDIINISGSLVLKVDRVVKVGLN